MIQLTITNRDQSFVMKQFWGALSGIIFSANCFLFSCNSDPGLPGSGIYSQPPPISSNATLKGRELVFDKNWTYWKDATGGQDELYVVVNPSDSFAILLMISYQTEISIQLEQPAIWMVLPQWQHGTGNGILFTNPNPMSSSNGYVWYFGDRPYETRNYFLIEGAYPVNDQLANKPVKVKVKFL